MEETLIWKGSPSQVLNCDTFAICALITLIFFPIAVFSDDDGVFTVGILLSVVPIIYSVYKYLLVACRVYEITTERIIVHEGILSRTRNSLELYRVRDISAKEPIWLRLCSLQNIEMITMDATDPELTIKAIPKAVGLYEQLRKAIEDCRDKKLVRSLDLPVV